ncbi:MAG TPA: hypothetical protein VM580_27290 [Labilithrix sp.]|nr:hypothetical protein [Labilithrix sp.]
MRNHHMFSAALALVSLHLIACAAPSTEMGDDGEDAVALDEVESNGLETPTVAVHKRHRKALEEAGRGGDELPQAAIELADAELEDREHIALCRRTFLVTGDGNVIIRYEGGSDCPKEETLVKAKVTAPK